MAGKTNLRAVQADESPPDLPEPKPGSKPKKTVAQAAQSKEPRELLVAMRDRIANAVTREDCQPRDLASLTKRLQDIVRDIATLDAIADQEGQKASKADGDSGDTYDASAI